MSLKEIINITLLFSFFLSVTVTFSKTGPVFYRQIVIDAKYDIITNAPVKANFARRLNCYKLSYYKDGRIKKIVSLRNGKRSNDRYLGVSKIKFKYKNEIEYRTYLNSKNKSITDLKNGVYAISKKEAEKKNIIKVTCLDDNFQIIPDKYGVTNYLI